MVWIAERTIFKFGRLAWKEVDFRREYPLVGLIPTHITTTNLNLLGSKHQWVQEIENCASFGTVLVSVIHKVAVAVSAVRTATCLRRPLS